MSDLSSTGGSASANSGASTSGTSTGTTGAVAAATTIDPKIDPKILADFGLTTQQITEMEQKYSIPASVKEKFPDLVALLIKTESMNTEEREYWFQVLPIMNDDQIVKLRDILVNERSQLKKIDTEYDEEMAKLGDTHKKEWNAFEAQQKKKVAAEQERKHEETEQKEEEDLLKKLQDS